MSSIQDDVEKLRKLYREYIQASSFIIFAVMMWLFVIAKPLVLLLLTEKWVESLCAYYIFCFDQFWINRSMYRAIGLRTLCTDAELILYQRFDRCQVLGTIY